VNYWAKDLDMAIVLESPVIDERVQWVAGWEICGTRKITITALQFHVNNTGSPAAKENNQRKASQ